VIEELTFGSQMTEEAVTLAALSLAGSNTGDQKLEKHVGYYLVDDGREQLEKKIDFKPGKAKRMLSFILRHPTACYLGAIALLTFVPVNACLVDIPSFFIFLGANRRAGDPGAAAGQFNSGDPDQQSGDTACAAQSPAKISF
jgi:hypothetical protein